MPSCTRVLASFLFSLGGVWGLLGLHCTPASTSRCSDGLSEAGPRCCGLDQYFANAGCRGKARGCAAGFTLHDGQCVAQRTAVFLAAGVLPKLASDWDDLPGNAELHQVAAFWLDSHEVNELDWQKCQSAQVCSALPQYAEPGLPARGMSPSAALAYCRFQGGRLPRAAEFLYAAAGTRARRFPWGNTGLVCRRASFGLEAGPCATQISGPDLCGARAAGKSPEGVYDLVGNVAEWTMESDERFAARGGSYKDQSAAHLKSVSRIDNAAPGADVGFRCAYDTAPLHN